MDDLLPVFLAVVVRARVPELGAHLAYVGRLCPLGREARRFVGSDAQVTLTSLRKTNPTFQLRFMNDFLDTDLASGETQVLVTTLRACYMHLHNM